MPKRQCTICCRTLKGEEFYPHPRGKFGLYCQCKQCVAKINHAHYDTDTYRAMSRKRVKIRRLTEDGKQYAIAYAKTEECKANRRRYRNSNKGKATALRELCRYPEKTVARAAIRGAVLSGALPRAKNLPCTKCGKQASHYHHHRGYDPLHMLDVIPVCAHCHNILHGFIKD